jgi:hypothetical protein
VQRIAALALDVDGIAQDSPSVPTGILGALRKTRHWLHHQSKGLNSLYDVYQTAESRRKGRRARLTKSLAGREKRAEWLQVAVAWLRDDRRLVPRLPGRSLERDSH